MLLKTKATLILLLTVSASLQRRRSTAFTSDSTTCGASRKCTGGSSRTAACCAIRCRRALLATKFDAACQQHSGSCGNYTLNGDKLTLQYKTGNSEIWSYKPLNGGIQLNYLILTPVEKYPAGARLNGSWDRALRPLSTVCRAQTPTITSPTFYTFRPDGTFTFLNVTGIDATSKVQAQTSPVRSRLNLPEHIPSATTF